ncbi:hypothetical protein E4U42_003102 [Claviceps africana]|uniref:Uncharacterized protein n=1 Tax=Claviceps africana TaxID=83212 RepID=A0A8K0J8I0_9HYPO|nr:hypothetical protein E4U42_003102 [Claviceps africana]
MAPEDDWKLLVLPEPLSFDGIVNDNIGTIRETRRTQITAPGAGKTFSDFFTISLSPLPSDSRFSG